MTQPSSSAEVFPSSTVPADEQHPSLAPGDAEKGSSNVALDAGGLRLERITGSKQFDGRVFRNTHRDRGPDLRGARWPLFRQYLFGTDQRTPEQPLPTERPHEAWLRPVESGLRVTWLGHSTVLLEIDGVRVLTDPVFGERVSPFSFVGPKRFHPVPAALSELPTLDGVLLSHDHYDHLCASTMRALVKSEVPIVTALGVGARLERLGIASERIVELDWSESTMVRGLRLTATPAQHFSGRGATDRNQTLWSSWVLETDRHKVFFSGDTGLTDEFVEIGLEYGPFDLVMLEVGAFHESWGDIHLGPQNALLAHQMLGGGTLLPVHWGTFSLALHAWNDPGETLVQLATQQNTRLLTPRLGQVFEPSHLDGPTPWWRGLR
jgi:L-ascorbate metabolism protein UlaG (beta-lactamase superfamily)